MFWVQAFLVDTFNTDSQKFVSLKTWQLLLSNSLRLECENLST